MRRPGRWTSRAPASVPWTLLVFLALLVVPFLGSRFYTFVATDIVILALFATSLNLLLGTTGLVSFGHAAYFGIGAYACALLMKSLAVPFPLAFLAGGVIAAGFAAFFGFFCVRLTKIYFAMLTLAFAQIVWAVCFKWNEVTGGEQGLPSVPYPELGWMEALPLLSDFRVGERFYLVALALVALALAALRRLVLSPFGRVLTVIRDNPERAQFIGVDVRLYELAAFVVAGFFAGLSGALFGIFNRGVFPDFAYWTKSAEPLIMTILGGMGHFWGPAVGAAALILLNQQITSYTEYWPFVLGSVLVVLLFVFPGGIVGTLAKAARRGRQPPTPAPQSVRPHA
jgi:branched-chain amino acid transport system permease protein